jgi:predicted HicB family RNase H-like nuclease
LKFHQLKKKNKMTEPEKTFSFKMPVSLLETSHEIARMQDLSLAQLIRRMLRELVAVEEVGQ